MESIVWTFDISTFDVWAFELYEVSIAVERIRTVSQ